MKGIEKTLIRRMNDMADPSCINLGLGELRFPTPKPILDHVRENIATWHLGYTPNEGLAELRKLIAEKSDYPIVSDQVCVTVGAEEALLAVIMVLVGSGDEVLIPDPGFPVYASIVRMAGGTPRAYPLFREDGFRLRAENILSLVTKKTKAVILNNPNNPSGAVYSREELKKLAEGLKDHGAMAISDEVYKEIHFQNRPDSIACHTDRSVVINSFSKSFCMTGWRIGWCTLPREMAMPLASFHQLSVTCAPAISQYAAIGALKGIADADTKRNLEELRRRRDLAMKCLDEDTDLKYVRSEGTFYIFVDISEKTAKFGNSFAIAVNLLSKEKVVAIPGSAFGRLGEGYLRLSFAAAPEHIEEGIRRLGRFLM